MNEATPEPRRCEVCGDPIRRDNKYGVCTNGSRPECIEARRRKRAEQAPVIRQAVVAAGQVFGNWTALEPCTAQKQYVLCRCQCGKERRVSGERLVTGRSRSCGCAAIAAMVQARFSSPYIPAGATFGRLTVLKDVPRSTDDALCHCACGKEKVLSAITVKAGRSRSCGCLGRERRLGLQGFSKHPLYATWNGMIDRCTDPRHPSYANYGGRGIQVSDRWFDPWVFAEDVEREIGPRPEGTYPSGRAMYSFDRYPDNDGNYEPGNIRWSTTSEQVLNQRKVSKMTLKLEAVTRERDALAAELAALKASLARKTGKPDIH